MNKKKYRIEVAVISDEMDWSEVGAVRDKLEKVMLSVNGIKEGLSSSICPFNRAGIT